MFLLFAFYACKSKEETADTKSSNYVDAARNFIRAALNGKFREAKEYMLQDSSNLNYLDVAERSYQRADQTLKDGYRASSIRIFPLAMVNDSVSIVIFSNSYKNDPDTLRILRVNKDWLVDLKYLYQHNLDTSLNKITTKDSLK